ncbi:MAG: hypothetical protein EBU49_04815 [Proteobacteria bacterium]|nr:hypothetical protein [Pseudomonadota bacterium]
MKTSEDLVVPVARGSSALGRQIDRESAFAHWRRNDITGRDPVAAVIGVLATPVVLFWSLIAGCITFSFTVLVGVFKILGKLFR